jgi:hypothetical protein
MKRFTTLALAAMFIFAISESKAQVPAGSFGLNAEFGSSAEELSLLYVLSHNIEIGLGIGYKSTSMSGDGFDNAEAVTEMGFNIYGAYYLSRGDVNPYVTLYLGYFMPPDETEAGTEYTYSELNISAAFGGQVFISKNFAVYVEAGLSYNTMSTTGKSGSTELSYSLNVMNLFTSAVGASIYF